MKPSNDARKPAPNQIQRFDKRLKKATALQEKGDFRGAALQWCEAARMNHDLAWPWLRANECQRRAGLSYEAVETLHEALRCNSAARALDAVLDENTAFPTESIPAARRDLWTALAETYLESQQWSHCIRACRYLLALNPREHYGRELLATALLHSGQILPATDVMRELLLLSPGDEVHRFKLATLLQMQGSNAAAMREYSRLVEESAPGSDLNDDTTEAIETLDNLQIRQILERAEDDFSFAQSLLQNIPATLEEHDFHLSENGLGSLRQILGDGRLAAVRRAFPVQ